MRPTYVRESVGSRMSGSWLSAIVSVFFCAWATPGHRASSSAPATRNRVMEEPFIVTSVWGRILRHAPRRGNPRRVRLAPMRSRFAGRIALVIALLALAASARPAGSADGPLVREGVHENAPFRYEVPARWNGGLVMFAHGYQGEGPGAGAGQTEPRDAHLAGRGGGHRLSQHRLPARVGPGRP